MTRQGAHGPATRTHVQASGRRRPDKPQAPTSCPLHGHTYHVCGADDEGQINARPVFHKGYRLERPARDITRFTIFMTWVETATVDLN